MSYEPELRGPHPDQKHGSRPDESHGYCANIPAELLRSGEFETPTEHPPAGKRPRTGADAGKRLRSGADPDAGKRPRAGKPQRGTDPAHRRPPEAPVDKDPYDSLIAALRARLPREEDIPDVEKSYERCLAKLRGDKNLPPNPASPESLRQKRRPDHG